MPFQGEFTHILVPRAMPWAKCLLAFQAVFRRIPETSIIHIIAVWGKQEHSTYAPIIRLS